MSQKVGSEGGVKHEACTQLVHRTTLTGRGSRSISYPLHPIEWCLGTRDLLPTPTYSYIYDR